MNIAEVLTPERTCCNAPGVSKKRVLEFISTFLEENTDFIDADDVYHDLLSRERLGSTAIGEGIAIPHCRVPGCPEITGVLLKLQTPVDFDAIDDAAVDLIFALIVPDQQNDEHLQVLSSIAELLQSSEVREKLRNCQSNDKLYQIATTGH
ncbi:MAG: PTS IIA-like nitrogen-regulatory protein PtsN [Gammaproteobacteria bacterium]|nr:MAG: PTS IIA-like nitrogen-regulatory protein PtsN [Gammaproteobacteria bacterium]RLA53603.1 MAG: PTS IIA-like nitrogen-regulatory protein PtsN [Gammaproteobacteria bacterium]